MPTHKDLPVLHFNSQAEFLDWLEDNHQSTQAYWLRFAKKGSGKSSISYVEAREAALMYGWIDGLLNRLDDEYYLLKFCHRRPKSNWSATNITLVTELLAQGKMKPEGIKEVTAAQADGRWSGQPF